MASAVPEQIGGAKPLFIAMLLPPTTVMREERLQLIEFAAVCQYTDDPAYYLFGCDSEYKTYTDYWFEDLDEALEEAKHIYNMPEISWVDKR